MCLSNAIRELRKSKVHYSSHRARGVPEDHTERLKSRVGRERELGLGAPLFLGSRVRVLRVHY